VTSVDALNVTVYIKQDLVPYKNASTAFSNVTNSFNGAIFSATQPDATVLGTLPVQTGQVFNPITLKWCPNYVIPDGTTGTYVVYAINNYMVFSTTQPQGTVNVIPDIAPTVTGSYGISVAENDPPTLQKITGTDVDIWDTTTLKMKLISVGPGITLNQAFGPTLNPGAILSSAPDGTIGTFANVNISYVTNYYGQTNFTYQMIDSFGKVSPIQTVPITVTFVPQRPVCQNYSLTLPENFCGLTACPNIYNIQHFNVSWTDVDSNSGTITLGAAFSGTGTGTFSSISAVGATTLSTTAPGGTFYSTSLYWPFWFVPALNSPSTGCSQPYQNTSTGCSIFFSVPYTVSDSYSLSSDTCYLTVTVYPVDVGPSCGDSTYVVNSPAMGADYYENFLYSATPAPDGLFPLANLTVVSITYDADPTTGKFFDNSTSALATTTYNPYSPAKWAFKFNNTHVTVVYNVSFLVFVTDSYGLKSSNCTITFRVDNVVLTPPNVTGANMTTAEDTPLTIPFNFQPNNVALFAQPTY